MQVSLAEL